MYASVICLESCIVNVIKLKIADKLKQTLQLLIFNWKIGWIFCTLLKK